MSLDMQADWGSDMLPSRAKLLEIVDTLGDTLPAKLQFIRKDGPDSCSSRLCLARQKAAMNKCKNTVEAGPSQTSKHLTQREVPREFEAEWARLPPAIAALPSFDKIKQLVMRTSKDRASFQHAMPVLHNGIDHCFMSRPAFRHILQDLESDSCSAMPNLIEEIGLLPSPVDPLCLTEALWESNFGVPRNLGWYSALAQTADGVSSCTSVRFAPPKPNRLGLSRISMDSAADAVHCAVGGTKRPLQVVGPASGLLLAVVQGSLLLIAWPSTDNNFDACCCLSRSLHTELYDHLDELEEPRINVLRTGDALYLPPGTSNIMVALTNVCLTSRQIFNPVSKELRDIVRCCNRLMETYIDQQSTGYSPFDELEVERLDAATKLWFTITDQLSPQELSDISGPTERKPTSLGQAMQTFACGLREINENIKRYRGLVYEVARAHQNEGPYLSPHYRPLEMLQALAKLSKSTERCEVAAASRPSDSTLESLYRPQRANLTPKGKDRVPS